MNTPGLVRSVSALVALAIVSACSGGSSVAPSTATFSSSYVGKMLVVNGRPVTAARSNPLPTYSQLVPEKKKSAKDYEYVLSYYQTYASIFDYPKGTSQIGQITNAGGQGCTNAQFGYGKKLIWNPGRNNDMITEYQVPSNKVLKNLSVGYSYTSSCSMDTAGDLAVGVLLGNSYNAGGQVVLFKKATGKPTVYQTPLGRLYFSGYDPKGNLFADGFAASGYSFGLVELPAGGKKAVTIKTSNSPQFPGSVQWDGTYLTVFDQDTAQVYQYTVSGTTATLKNTVSIDGSSDCAQTWIVKGLLYCGDYGNNEGYAYKYPSGGSPIATFSGNFDGPLGVVAAQK